MERHGLLALLASSFLFLGVTAWIGTGKIAEFDELATYYPAALGSTSAVWEFYAAGLDTNTPTASLITHASVALFGDNHLAMRLPVILGYWLMCLSIYGFVSFRSSRLYGLAAMWLPPVTSVYFYATEARSYGMLLGATAFALLCWQRATSGQSARRWLWLLLLGLSLALSISLHYLTILIWGPLGVAELVRTWERRGQEKKIDWAMWGVLLAGLLPLALFIPLMLTARENYLGGFWAQPSLRDIENSYRSILTLAFAPMLGVAVLWLLAPLGRDTHSDPDTSTDLARKQTPLAEWVVIIGVALTPFYAVPLMLIAGTFVARYVLFTLTGLTLLLALTAFRRTGADQRFALIALVCLSGWFVLKQPLAARAQLARNGGAAFAQTSLANPDFNPFDGQPWMDPVRENPDLPVLLNPAVFFLPFQHYADDALKERTFYLTNTDYALQYDGADTGDRGLLSYAQRIPLQVPDYDEFVATHPEFLVLAETTNPTWVLEKLRADGVRLQLLNRTGTYYVFHATMPSVIQGDAMQGDAIQDDP